MSIYQKQYSSYNILPNSKDEIITVVPRKFLKNDLLINKFNIKNELPLFLYLMNLILNIKNSKEHDQDFLILKKSTLRNFIRRKCHSELKVILDDILDSFLEKMKDSFEGDKLFNIECYSNNTVKFQILPKYLKMLEKNTVSFNLIQLTKLRGEKAKKIFLKLFAYDLRTHKRYFNLSSISKYLNLNCFDNRKRVIRTLKRAFLSLKRSNIIQEMKYIGIDPQNYSNNYRFNFYLGNIKQST